MAEIRTLINGQTQISPRTTAQAIENLQSDLDQTNNIVNLTKNSLNSLNNTTTQIGQNLQSLDQIKTDIKNAIITKGVEILDGTPFDNYSSKINEIKGQEFAKVTLTPFPMGDIVGSITIYYVDGTEKINKISVHYPERKTIKVLKNSIIYGETSFPPFILSGDIEKYSEELYQVMIVKGNCEIYIRGSGGSPN